MTTPRRTPGVSAFTRQTLTASQYASHGSNLRATHESSLQTQLSVFQSLLQEFSITHAKEIRRNPAFRAEFARMCNAIGVDPLVSSNTAKKGSGGSAGGSFWTQMLGGSVNDFYFELAVRVVEVCRDTRSENGGMLGVDEVARRVQKGRAAIGGTLEEVSDDDVLRAVKSLEPLGSGFKLVKLGSRTMIRSVPKELNTDQTVVLEAVQVLGYVTLEMLMTNLGWTRIRAVAAIDDLIADSLLWVDTQADEVEYWTPAVMHAGGSMTT